MGNMFYKDDGNMFLLEVIELRNEERRDLEFPSSPPILCRQPLAQSISAYDPFAYLIYFSSKILKAFGRQL
jgi:hypothetical protein